MDWACSTHVMTTVVELVQTAFDILCTMKNATVHCVIAWGYSSDYHR